MVQPAFGLSVRRWSVSMARQAAPLVPQLVEQQRLRFLERWKDIFPEARVERIADAGHYILEDAPEVIPLIREHLTAD